MFLFLQLLGFWVGVLLFDPIRLGNLEFTTCFWGVETSYRTGCLSPLTPYFVRFWALQSKVWTPWFTWPAGREPVCRVPGTLGHAMRKMCFPHLYTARKGLAHLPRPLALCPMWSNDTLFLPSQPTYPCRFARRGNMFIKTSNFSCKFRCLPE